jgi:hypothetical protein
MLITNFSDFFSFERDLFRKLVTRLRSAGCVTDENFGVTRCLFETVSERHFNTVFGLHFPGIRTRRVARNGNHFDGISAPGW